MPRSESNNKVLLEKANSLPLVPGVYIMYDKGHNIIYVGKSRKLKNRVSQYFQNSDKSIKTHRMVSSVADFDYILCKTEIEALTLENSLIKKHTPKYNIKLKDAKSYPYIKVTDGEFPNIIVTRTRAKDKGKYFGPFSGVSTAYSILDILHKSLGIPSCKRRFPAEIGKARPCIYLQMRQCCGLCTGNVTAEDYNSLISCAVDILNGNINGAKELLGKHMLSFAQAENFEAAAKCRDTIVALEKLNQKQNVIASPDTDIDVFGFCMDDVASCMSVIYVRNGLVIDKVDYVFNSSAIVDDSSLISFFTDHYMNRDSIPKNLLLSFDLPDEDIKLLEEFLTQRAEHRVSIKHPERGQSRKLADIALNNAKEKSRQVRISAQKEETTLFELASLLGLETLPERIEAYDISNIGSENITAGMVVFENGKPKKSEYRSFKIKSLEGTTNDYASIREALTRRLQHLSDSTGSFSKRPDIILVDGGKGHTSVAKEVLNSLDLDIPVFGMVKDDFHKTRALCDDEREISIAKERSVYMLIYAIQEEVHRFTVGRTMSAKRSTLKRSSLENIAGIGPAKAKRVLARFATISALKNASEAEISATKGISKADAHNIYLYFHTDAKK